MKKLRKIFLYTGVALLLFIIYFLSAIYISVPIVEENSIVNEKRISNGQGALTLKNNWLRQNSSGLWEMYLEGNGYERGIAHGKLTKELGEIQEIAFIDQIRLLIPSDAYLNFLKFFVAYFNRHLPDHITKEYQQEIYGVSLFASDLFDFVAPKYYRILNYHGAHDIGHALQDKNMTVGCTSFGAWGKNTEDGNLIIGRNFDFYSGDAFAKNKIVAFVKPDSGYAFAYVTWAGFTGVVSGINQEGLCVTINASKSDIPTGAATPISLLAKEILQYSKNSAEAFAIAEKRKTFVSESILIGSATENRAFIIEKTPTRVNMHSETNDNVLVCPNHYTSKYFSNDYTNNLNRIESSSEYRFNRMRELITSKKELNPEKVAEILRDTKGNENKFIGYGNEKSINQLIAHHAVIFQPIEKKIWVSANPFQLGKMHCYDLDEIFNNTPSANIQWKSSVNNIPEDPFARSISFKKYQVFRMARNYLVHCTRKSKYISADEKILNIFESLNPKSYLSGWTLGDYYMAKKEFEKAVNYYQKALTKVCATQKEEIQIKESLLEAEMLLKDQK